MAYGSTTTFLKVAYGTSTAFTGMASSVLKEGTLYFTTDDKYLRVKVPGASDPYIICAPEAAKVSKILTITPVNGNAISYNGSNAATISINTFLDATNHIPIEYIPRAAIERIYTASSSATSVMAALVGDEDGKAQIGDLIKIENASDTNNGKVYFVGGTLSEPTFTEFTVGTASVAASLSNTFKFNVNGTETSYKGGSGTLYISQGITASSVGSATANQTVTAASGSKVYVNLLGTKGNSSTLNTLAGLVFTGTEPVRVGADSGTITISVQGMTGASASAAGKTGLVPAPAAGKNTAFLRGDGTWVVPSDTHHTAYFNVATSATATTLANANIANGGIFLNLVENNAVRSTYKLTGAAGIGAVYTTSDKTITIGHTNSTITAGTVGPSAATINANGTFTVPKVTYDTYGHITSCSGITIKLGNITQPTHYTTTNGAAELATIFGTTIYGGVVWDSF